MIQVQAHRGASAYAPENTLPSVQGYTAEQTHEGWMVTFSSSMFTASTYTFTFEIFTRTGGANLTITNPWYNPVQYTGTISQLY